MRNQQLYLMLYYHPKYIIIFDAPHQNSAKKYLTKRRTVCLKIISPGRKFINQLIKLTSHFFPLAFESWRDRDVIEVILESFLDRDVILVILESWRDRDVIDVESSLLRLRGGRNESILEIGWRNNIEWKYWISCDLSFYSKDTNKKWQCILIWI